jgi:Cu(I)/Ag(I) efflux system membrane fusion protein
MNETAQSFTADLKRLLVRWAFVLAAFGLFATWAAWRMNSAASRLPDAVATSVQSEAVEPEIEYWTCTMHPEVRQSDPGNCPKCGMELVPKYVGSDEPGVKPPAVVTAAALPAAAGKAKQWYRCTMPECGDVGSADPDSRCPVCGMKREPVGAAADQDAGKYEIALSERAQRLAELATEPARYRQLRKRIRTVGKITYDETRHKIVSAWTAGRVDKLFADFTGMVVSKGDHLVEIYSPELVSAQEEYLQALRVAEELGDSATEAARRSARQLVASARRKLDLLGVTAAQIDELDRMQTAATHLVVYAPLGGTIVGKSAMEGMYVKTGDVLYEIADLTYVWLLIDLYEADLPWVRPFQEVRVTAQSLPGEEFHGQTVFVDPVVDRKTRTVKVRVNVPNPDRRLKPEMFVTAEIEALVGEELRAVAPPAGGAYACPMHPWETAGERTICPICEMDMVPVESIPGYSPPGQPVKLLSVPREAVMQTGERALAYVQVAPGTYRGVEIRVGPLAEDETGRQFYPVLSGLSEDDLVVTRGNFVIDSQMQIAGKPSLFNARGLGAPPVPHHGHREMLVPDKPTAPSPDQHTADGESVQTLCPVMGNPIDKEIYVDYRGVRVYFCCRGCDKKFLADPAKYIPNFPEPIRRRIAQAEGRERSGEND